MSKYKKLVDNQLPPNTGKETIWYRGEHCNFLANKSTMIEGIPSIEKYILSGLVPKNPFITRENGVTAFGSCFASGIYSNLKNWGYNVDPLKDFGEKPHYTHVAYHQSSMVNTFAILQQFQWAYEGRQFPEDLWQDRPNVNAGNDSVIAESTKALFDNTDVFIITLGLSEVWYSKETGDVFWRAIPENTFDPNKHGFKVSTFAETKDNLEQTIDIIRKYRPDASIIFSLSPIRLKATFRPIACLPANSVSKAILRAALDEVLREREEDQNLFYWPSYEIVMDVYPDLFNEDNRHPKAVIINNVMAMFRKYYLI